MFMSDSPAPRTGRIVNRVQLGDFLGVSLPTVDAYVRRGCPFVQRGNKGQEWQFNSADVVAWIKEDAVEQALGRADDPDIDAARLRKTLAEAELAELELARRRGKLISEEHITHLVTDAFSIVRTGVLAIPNHIAVRMPPELSRQAFGIVTDCVNDVLTALSEGRVLEAAAKEDEAA